MGDRAIQLSSWVGNGMEFRVREDVRNKGAQFKPLPKSQLHCEFGEQEGLVSRPWTGPGRAGRNTSPGVSS